jgi:ketosteroid isomerase-like protein
VSAADNKQAAIDGYAAFSKGDLDGAMVALSDDVQWVVPGDSSVSGTYRGKQEVLGFWMKLGEKKFEVMPSEFVADGNKVVALVSNRLEGETINGVDVLEFDDDGKLVRFETFGDSALMDRVFAE